MLIIFLFAPLKKFSYFCTSDIPSFKLLAFFTSSLRFAFSSPKPSRIDSCNSSLIASGVFFLFVFLTLQHNYKWKKVSKPFWRFNKHSKSTRFSPSHMIQKVKQSCVYDKNFWENLNKNLYVFSRLILEHLFLYPVKLFKSLNMNAVQTKIFKELSVDLK